MKAERSGLTSRARLAADPGRATRPWAQHDVRGAQGSRFVPQHLKYACPLERMWMPTTCGSAEANLQGD